MAILTPPQKKTKNKKSTFVTPKSNKATEQSPPSTIKPIQLKIPENKKNEFKAYAAIRGRSMNTLFLEMFEEYKSTHG